MLGKIPHGMPRLENLIKACCDSDPEKRPDFVFICTELEQIRIQAAFYGEDGKTAFYENPEKKEFFEHHTEAAAKWWSNNFKTETSVKLGTLLSAYMKNFDIYDKPPMSLNEYREEDKRIANSIGSLCALLIGPPLGADIQKGPLWWRSHINSDIVSIERFGEVCTRFGPFGLHAREMMDEIAQLMGLGQFFGDTSGKPNPLKGQSSDKYYIRYNSTQPTDLTLECTSKKYIVETIVKKQMGSETPMIAYVIGKGQPFLNRAEAIKSFAERYKIVPCPGSPYILPSKSSFKPLVHSTY